MLALINVYHPLWVPSKEIRHTMRQIEFLSFGNKHERETNIGRDTPSMEDTLRDTVLKPIMKRKRQHQDRTKRRKKKPKQTNAEKINNENVMSRRRRKRQKIANVSIKSLNIGELKTFVYSAIEDCDLKRVVELKEEIDAYAKEILYPMLEPDHSSPVPWMKKLDRQDVLHLIHAMDPIPMAVEHILTLPTTLSKLYNVSNFELLPSIYHKDHVWLTLQWTIDGVDNPFMSRPCSNTPCLGSYLKGEGESEPLPELVPLSVLDKMMEWTSQGMTLSDFCVKLREKRDNPRDTMINFTLGRDTPFPPRCLLCCVQEVFNMAMDPSNRLQRSITLDTYKRCCMVQFDDMRQDIMVNFDIKWVLHETGVILPRPMIPFPGVMVSLMKRKENREICIDELFP